MMQRRKQYGGKNCEIVHAVFIVCLLFSFLAEALAEQTVGNVTSNGSKTVKKELVKMPPEIDNPPEPVEIHHQSIDGQQAPVEITISEKSLAEIKKASKSKGSLENVNDKDKAIDSKPAATTVNSINVDEPNYKQQSIYGADDIDVPDLYKSVFYIFFGLSSIGILFIALKLYRMRLSRAERKYGVQGDRSTQELTPLPVSIEDGNSDEDDQTLFEINRQQIRIL